MWWEKTSLEKERRKDGRKERKEGERKIPIKIRKSLKDALLLWWLNKSFYSLVISGSSHGYFWKQFLIIYRGN